MNDEEKSKAQLIAELEDLRRQVADLQLDKLHTRQGRQEAAHLDQLRAIYFLADMISQSESVAEIYGNAVNALRIVLHARAAAISLFDEAGGAYIETWLGLSEKFRQAIIPYLPWSPTEKHPTPLFVTNVNNAPIAQQLCDLALAENFQAMGFIPLIYHNKTLGHFMFAYDQPHQFSEAELWLTQTVASHVAFATERRRVEVEQKRLLAAEREQRLLAETLGEVFLALTAQTSRKAVLDKIFDQVRRFVSYTAADIAMLEGEVLKVVRSHGYRSEEEMKLLTDFNQNLSDFPLAHQVVASQQSRVVPDTWQEPNWVVVDDMAWIRSYVGVPISSKSRVLGILRLTSDTPDTFSNVNLTYLQPLANAAAIALENAWLYDRLIQELNERIRAEQEASGLNQRFLTLQYASATIASSLDIQLVVDTLTREMVDLLAVRGCLIYEWNEETDTVVIIARYGPDDRWPHRSLGVAYNLADVPLMQWVITEHQAQYLTCHQTDIDPSDLTYMKREGIKTLLMLPMEIQNRVTGLIEVVDDETEREFTSDEIAFAQLLANQAAAALENARLYSQARREIAERVEAEQALQQMATRNQAILNAIPDFLFYFSRDGRLLDYKLHHDDNLPPWGQFSEVSLDNEFDNEFHMPVELFELMMAYIEKTLATESMQLFEYQVTTPLKPLDFETRMVMSGENEILAIVRDITERKQAERQMIRAERLAALGQLAAALAHEINNPLQAIQSYLDLLLKYPLEPGENEEYLQIIRRQIDRVAEITRHVLNFARPHSTSRHYVDLGDLIEQVLILVRKQLERSKFQVRVNIMPDISPIWASPDQLTQVFLNLIMNAVEATPDGHGQLHIAIYNEYEDTITLSFTSNSQAIPEDILPHIFEPFFTTKPDGSGLGLWVSHSLVQQHGGSLAVENLTSDKGVIFTVKLPANQK